MHVASLGFSSAGLSFFCLPFSLFSLFFFLPFVLSDYNQRGTTYFKFAAPIDSSLSSNLSCTHLVYLFLLGNHCSLHCPPCMII
ncbi:hypothetical protein HYPSUDRAFT_1034217 [Hypholoma sublateritium FD-334 SS-4]|uniref:Uncharacterized protein n=1 Tax=Hypholoma sublateritium (strain FD-334 SS-4) TaxID=945553 RepID=A0A0D2LGW9_HYPSF|nr:hypothetical protein HYPSUDRAFT_1034217 [Hypholoma sublateritium FD-334 SS-4]